jgi:hypothetical protein
MQGVTGPRRVKQMATATVIRNKALSAWNTTKTFASVGGCSAMLFNVVNHVHDHPLPEEENASSVLADGIWKHGYECGTCWGARPGSDGFHTWHVSGVDSGKSRGSIPASRGGRRGHDARGLVGTVSLCDIVDRTMERERTVPADPAHTHDIEEMLEAIRRFRRLSAEQKIRATMLNNSATRRILELGARELRRSR